MDDFLAITEWLSRPESYRHACVSVEKIETHISCVFLAGPLVYKLKKPVHYDFLDFSTPGAREQACREEVRLNRRLAPHVYRGVVPVARDTNGTFAWEGQGEIVDWLVEMQRLPQDKTLDELHRRGALRLEDIDRLAGVLADFYAKQPSVTLSPEVYRSRYLTRVRANGAELSRAAHHLPADTIQRVQAFQVQMLLLGRLLFDQRVEQGRILEGHGDLRPEHICFSDPLAIFDCLEFSPELRQLDIADELAFLSEECELIGAPWAGERLVQKLANDIPPILFDFYRAYRATVRAKVSALRAEQLPGRDREAAATDAAAHLTLAEQYSRRHYRPLMLVVRGPSGSGKSTLAGRLASEFGAELLRSDVIRQELFATGGAASESQVSQYTSESRERVYQEMFKRASLANQRGLSVILDATFANLDHLWAAQALAAYPQTCFFTFECTCSADTARGRIEARRQAAIDPSEADASVLDQQLQAWQRRPDDTPGCIIDSERPLAEQFEQAIEALAAAWRNDSAFSLG